MGTHDSCVGRETARMLKEAGFNWETMWAWNEADGGLYAAVVNSSKPYNEKKGWIAAPTFEAAQKWVREECHIDITIEIVEETPRSYKASFWEVYSTDYGTCVGLLNDFDIGIFTNYEECLEKAIHAAALDVVHNKKQIKQVTDKA